MLYFLYFLPQFPNNVRCTLFRSLARAVSASISLMTTTALLHYTAPPIVGGVESVIEHHARLLADGGHDVRIIAGRGRATNRQVRFVKVPLLDSLHPRVLAAKAELDAGSLPAGWGRLVADTRRRLEEALEGVQVLLAHNVCSLHKNLALTAALHELAGQPDSPRLVLWHHDLAWGSARYAAELHLGRPWDLLRTAWAGATQVTISAARRVELAKLMNIQQEQILTIPNGVSPQSFYKLGRLSSELTDRLGLLSASPLLLLPARITARKNIELSLRALARLRESMPTAALLVTGPLGAHNPANQRYFESLKTLRSELKLEGTAHFLAEQMDGYVPDEAIHDFYRLADALLLPSRDEGFGIPVLEAGLAGLPVFCAAIPALQELSRDDAHYFSPDADPAQVAALIANTLQASPAWRLRARVRSEYTWQQIYNHYLAPLVVV